MKIKKLSNRGFAHTLLVGSSVLIAAIIGTFLLVNTSAGVKCTTRTYKQGSSGKCVRAIQAAVGVVRDGEYGPNTVAAVKKAQSNFGIKSDGKKVTTSTWDSVICPLLGRKAFEQNNHIARKYYNEAYCV